MVISIAYGLVAVDYDNNAVTYTENDQKEIGEQAPAQQTEEGVIVQVYCAEIG